MQNFTLSPYLTSVLIDSFTAAIIVIVPNVVCLFTAQTHWIPDSGGGANQTVHRLKEVKLSQAYGRVAVRWLLTYWESMYNIWFDQLLVIG